MNINEYNKIALIGPSGCGKSTIAKNLLSKEYKMASTDFIQNYLYELSQFLLPPEKSTLEIDVILDFLKNTFGDIKNIVVSDIENLELDVFFRYEFPIDSLFGKYCKRTIVEDRYYNQGKDFLINNFNLFKRFINENINDDDRIESVIVTEALKRFKIPSEMSPFVKEALIHIKNKELLRRTDKRDQVIGDYFYISPSEEITDEIYQLSFELAHKSYNACILSLVASANKRCVLDVGAGIHVTEFPLWELIKNKVLNIPEYIYLQVEQQLKKNKERIKEALKDYEVLYVKPTYDSLISKQILHERIKNQYPGKGERLWYNTINDYMLDHEEETLNLANKIYYFNEKEIVSINE